MCRGLTPAIEIEEKIGGGVPDQYKEDQLNAVGREAHIK